MIAPVRVWLRAKFAGQEVDQEMMNFAVEASRPILDTLEGFLAKHAGGFLTGDNATIADL